MSDKKSQAIIIALQNFLSQGGNLDQLKQVSRQVNNLVNKQQQTDVVLVSSAAELTDPQKKTIEQTIFEKTAKNYTFEFNIDPTLLGGMKIKINDHVIDLSIDSVLNQVVSSLKG